MKLISFDVGIKNMAFCMFRLSDQTLLVQDWGVLNLMDDETAPVFHCNCTLQQKKTKAVPNPPIVLCEKRAKYQKNGGFFCELHAKKSESWTIPNKTMLLSSLKKQSRDDLVSVGLSHGAFLADPPRTKKDCLAILQEHFQTICFEPILSKKTKSAGETDLITIGRNLRAKLDERPIQGLTHVIIENQISTIATRMKTIQGMLAQYYIMCEDQPQIDFISSANKLKHLVITPLENKHVQDINNNSGTKNNYKQHKQDAILFSKQFIANNPMLGTWSNVLDTPKKDDLADAFLQGIWYLKQAKLITYAENLNIKLV
jgi:hypothetical protein